VFRSSDRAATRAALKAAGVGTAIHYPLAITQQPAYRDLAHGQCEESEAWAAECISVPCFPELTGNEVERVCSALAGVSE
jgi:dTDP-4-amino-4,6-dideoxygalactose transaminase